MTAPHDPLLFVGSYAAPDQPGVHVFTSDDPAARPERVGAATGLVNPSFLLPHPAGHTLYAVAETDPGSVAALAIEWMGDDIVLRSVHGKASGGAHPCHLAIDHRGRWITVANYTGGTVSVLRIAPDGSLGEVVNTVRHAGSGPNSARQEAPHPHATVFSPDDRFLVVADLGIDQLVIYRVDPATGALAEHRSIATAPGAGPRHLVFSPRGSHLHVVNELDNTLASYRWDEAAGDASVIGVASTLEDRAAPGQAAAVVVSPDGGTIFASNRGPDSLAVMRFDDTGGPSMFRNVGAGGTWPRDMALDPRGTVMVVANRRSNTVIGVDLETGAPLWSLDVDEPSSIALSHPAP